MTQLQLVEVDPEPGGLGLPNSRKIKAVSSSHSALVDYCQKAFGQQVGSVPGKSMWDVYYEIENSNIVIVQEVITKF